MRAAVYHGRRDVRIEDQEPPSLEPGTVRIEVSVCGICGSDLHEFASGPIAIPAEEPHPTTGEALPLTLGHEFAGTVVETATDVTAVEPDERVVCNPIVSCGRCRPCLRGSHALCDDVVNVGIHGRGGGFASEVVVPATNVVPLPSSLPLTHGALVEPLSVALHAVRTSPLKIGDSTAVFGAGPIGLATMQAALAAGANPVFVSEPRDFRRELAAELGASEALDPTTTEPVRHISEMTDGGVDVAFEVAGVESSLTQAIRSTRKEGDVTIVSVFEEPASFQPNYLMMAERTLRGSYGYQAGPLARDGEFATTVQMLEEGQFDADRYITDHISLNNIVSDGFEPLLDPTSEHVKILVEPA